MKQFRNKIILTLYDPSVMVEEIYLIETDLDEDGLRDEIDKTVEIFEEQGYEDWSYDDIILELQKKGLIVLHTDVSVIRLRR